MQKVVLGAVGVKIGGPVTWKTKTGTESRDLNDYDTITIEAQAPSNKAAGTFKTWSGPSIEGVGNDEAWYTTQADDLDEAGLWRYRVRAEDASPALDVASEWVDFEVTTP